MSSPDDIAVPQAAGYHNATDLTLWTKSIIHRQIGIAASDLHDTE